MLDTISTPCIKPLVRIHSNSDFPGHITLKESFSTHFISRRFTFQFANSLTVPYRKLVSTYPSTLECIIILLIIPVLLEGVFIVSFHKISFYNLSYIINTLPQTAALYCGKITNLILYFVCCLGTKIIHLVLRK